MPRRVLLATCVLLLGALPTRGADEAAIEAGKSRLFVRPPDGFRELHETADQLARSWEAGDGSHVLVSVFLCEKARFNIRTVEEEFILLTQSEQTAPGRGDRRFKFATKETVGGPYGEGGYAIVGTADRPCSEAKTGEILVLCGMLDQHGYYVQVEAKPGLDAERRAALLGFLRTSVRAETPAVDRKWTDEEVKSRWAASVPEKMRRQMKPVVRTEHFIVFSNTAGGKKLAAQMEKNLEAIRKVLPPPAAPPPRLLPLFLFAKAEDYRAYYVLVTGRTPEQARSSHGSTTADALATYEGAPGDPTRVRSATRHYLRAWLHLDRGPMWYVRGLEGYVEQSPDELATWSREVARRRGHVPFSELFATRKLEEAIRPDDPILRESASLFAFLREGRWNADKFPEFVRRLGSSAEDGGEVEGILREVYGTDVEGLEAAWLEHWASS